MVEPPVPGIDPYLEHADYWSSFQHHLAEELMTMLNAQLSPKYVADVEPLPALPIPLLSPDPDIPLDLTVALQRIYARARYERRVDYHAAPPPPELSPAEAAWLDARLREHGLRV